MSEQHDVTPMTRAELRTELEQRRDQLASLTPGSTAYATVQARVGELLDALGGES